VNEVVADVQHTLDVFVEPGGVVELRAPKTSKGLASGYFDNLAEAAYVADELTRMWGADGVYFCLNPCRPDLLARAVNRVKSYAKYTTGDADIVRLRWLLIDLDAVRPAGISSTDGEHDAALARAHEVRDWLLAHGWPPPIVADSGNGAHVLRELRGRAQEDRPRRPRSGTDRLGSFRDRRLPADRVGGQHDRRLARR
jgi:hypothetical protein